MGLSQKDLGNLVNKMYFKDKMLIPDIASKLNIPEYLAIRKLDRTLFVRKSVCKFDEIAINTILDEVSRYFNIDKELILMKSRIKEVLVPRQIAHKLAYELTNASNSYIGSRLGSVDHATVTTSRSVINDFLDYMNKVDDSYNELYNICKKRVEDEKTISSGVY